MRDEILNALALGIAEGDSATATYPEIARAALTALEAAGYVVVKKDMETFVNSIAWGPPHIIEYNTYINSLVDKAQKLCPRVAEVYEFPQTKEKK